MEVLRGAETEADTPALGAAPPLYCKYPKRTLAKPGYMLCHQGTLTTGIDVWTVGAHHAGRVRVSRNIIRSGDADLGEPGALEVREDDAVIDRRFAGRTHSVLERIRSAPGDLARAEVVLVGYDNMGTGARLTRSVHVRHLLSLCGHPAVTIEHRGLAAPEADGWEFDAACEGNGP